MAKPTKKSAKKAPKAPPREAGARKLKTKVATKPKAKKKARRLAALPLPPDIPPPNRLPKPPVDPVSGALAPYSVATAAAAILDELWRTVEARRLAGDAAHSHSARLLARGTAKVAQKLGEEAVECVIEAATGNRTATVLESADLLYHLIVVWVDAGIRPEEVWTELARRQGISGIAEKAARPKGIVRAAETTKLP